MRVRSACAGRGAERWPRATRERALGHFGFVEGPRRRRRGAGV